MHVTLRPGPQLVKIDWEDGAWVEEDVTDKWMTYLFWPECKIEGATLADCLRLMKRDLAFSKVVFNMWIEEFIEEGLNDTSKPDTDLLSLELYVWHEVDEDGLMGLPFPSVHAPAKDIEYSIMFMSAGKLSHLPITLGPFRIWDDTERPYKERFNSETYPVSLGQILYALIWELSFCGAPKERDKKNKETLERCEEYGPTDSGEM